MSRKKALFAEPGTGPIPRVRWAQGAGLSYMLALNPLPPL